MKIDLSIELSKKCIKETICCRKSYKIVPYEENQMFNLQKINTYTPHIGSSHKDGCGFSLLIILFLGIFCCILTPILGLILGPLVYLIENKKVYIHSQPTLTPTLTPTLIPTLLPINNKLYNINY